MNEKSRPGEKAALPKNIADTAESSVHPALDAADSAPWFDRLAWDEAIGILAGTGDIFSADRVRLEFPELPDIGAQRIGGCFMYAHKRGVIRRVGYTVSTRGPRRGGVLAVWVGAE